MDFSVFINDALTTVVSALILAVGSLLAYGIKVGINYLKSKDGLIKDETIRKTLDSILDSLYEFTSDSVKSVEATFVEATKASGDWNDDTKKEAFQKAYDNVIAKLGEDSIEFLISQGKNVVTLITDKIESLNKELNK